MNILGISMGILAEGIPTGSILGLLVLLLLFAPPPFAPRVTQFKALPQVESFPGAQRLGERWSPLGTRLFTRRDSLAAIAS